MAFPYPTFQQLLLNQVQALGNGGDYSPKIDLTTVLTGTQTGTVNAILNMPITDTMNAGFAGLYGLEMDYTVGGIGSDGITTSGNRVGILSQMNINGTNAQKANGGTDLEYSPFWAYAYGNANQGGTSLDDAFGVLWGGIFSAQLNAGATFWEGVLGGEVDVACAGSARNVGGLNVYFYPLDTGTRDLTYGVTVSGIGLNGDTPVNGCDIVYAVGNPAGAWPCNTTTTMYGAFAPLPGVASGPLVAKYGLNLIGITFETAAIETPGFLLDPTGNLFPSGVNLANTQHIAFADANGGPLEIYGNASNQWIFSTTNASGAPITAISIPTHNNLPIAQFPYPIQIGDGAGNAGGVEGSGPGAPTSTTPGYALKGSRWWRTDGGVGTTLYISGGSVWNAQSGIG